MKILPTAADFRQWTACVPVAGDLLFFDAASLRGLRLPYPVYTVDEARAQSLDLWTLNMRSWYGYALNRSVACMWLPAGELEKLEPALRERLARAQVALEVPTLIPASLLSSRLRMKIPRYGKRHWLSSAVWERLSSAERAAALEAWGRAHKVFIHDGPSFGELGREAQSRLRSAGLAGLLNRYAAFSGPNCLACIAGAIAGPDRAAAVAMHWMHGAPFLRHLRASGYVPVRGEAARVGDVLVFSRRGEVVHAGYCLDDSCYFEKPGQDFYEPYRVEALASWRKHWPGCTLRIWRS
jgi:hypothetical protein